MFKREQDIRGTIFVFPYRGQGTRMFHTFFCSPLRIVGVNSHGAITFDEVVPPNRFVRIPRARIVLELSPNEEVDVEDVVQQALIRSIIPMWPWGAYYEAIDEGPEPEEDSLIKLFATVIKLARRDLKRAIETNAWIDRVHAAVSGAYLLTAPETPDLVRREARQRLDEIGINAEDAAEAFFAEIYGETQWLRGFTQCLKCGNGATWRQVIERKPTRLSDWRYLRPENYVPICRACARYRFKDDEKTRKALAYLVWGERFAALNRWHEASQKGILPEDWDKEEYPLWPPQFGGQTWEEGSGHRSHASPDECKTYWESLPLREEHRRLVGRILRARRGVSFDEITKIA